MSEGRRPHEVKVTKKKPPGDTSKSFWTRVGVAWPNSKGGFKIVLDPGIALVGGEDADIMIWPPFEGERGGGGGGRRQESHPQQSYQDDLPGDDDIPF